MVYLARFAAENGRRNGGTNLSNLDGPIAAHPNVSITRLERRMLPALDLNPAISKRHPLGERCKVIAMCMIDASGHMLTSVLTSSSVQNLM